MANEFNTLFTNIGPKLAREIENNNSKTIYDYLKEGVAETVFLRLVTK